MFAKIIADQKHTVQMYTDSLQAYINDAIIYNTQAARDSFGAAYCDNRVVRSRSMVEHINIRIKEAEAIIAQATLALEVSSAPVS